jgi:hypothetical protein
MKAILTSAPHSVDARALLLEELACNTIDA